MRTMGKLAAAVVLLATLAARAEDPAVTAFRRVDGAVLSPDEAKSRVHELVLAMSQAGLSRTSTIALSLISGDAAQDAAVREAARAELAARAAQDPGFAQSLLAKQDEGAKLPPLLSLRLARAHLERALQLAPLEEGVAFQAIQGPPAAVPADADASVQKPAASTGGASSHVAAEQIDRARALAASVPAGDALETEAHEVSGLAALAANDNDGAQREFLAVSQAGVRRGDDEAGERRDRALLQLARIAYAQGDDAKAEQIYRRVSRGAPEWLDALFEASWSHFRRGEDEKALGNLLTLHAPFFQGRFFPESFVLKALVLYENCRYGDARRALADFEQRYRPLHDGLAELLGKLPTAQGAYEFLAGGPVVLAQTVAPGAREDVARLEQEPDLRGSLAAVSELGQEIDSFDGRPPEFRRIAQRLAPAARQARLELLETTGRRLLSRLNGERGDLRELLGQSLRLSFEIAGREKELASTNEPAAVAPPKYERPSVDDDEVLWPFEGEYWRDELGTYRYHLGQRCRGGAKVTPVQTAAQPPAKPRAAAVQP